MKRPVTKHQLETRLLQLQKISRPFLSLDGAYGGYRVEANGILDFLGTGYTTKRKLLEAIDVAITFHQVNEIYRRA